MRWSLRQKKTRKFRSRASFKKDLKECSQEPWEIKNNNRIKCATKRKYPKSKF